MHSDDLLEITKCLQPCTFMEYIVSSNSYQNIFLVFDFFTELTFHQFQMTETPLKYSNFEASRVLLPYLKSNTIEVQREEEAFPIGSMVADVGGALGLFIGFNFLMIWDWIVLVWHKFCIITKKSNIAFISNSK